jgi:hypothetical protein
MRRLFRGALVALPVVILLSGFALAGEEKVKSKDLPKEVSKTLSERFPDLQITSAVKETEADGKVVYDIELKQNGRKFETDINPDGTMIEVEKEIAKKDWVKPLSETVEAKFPKGNIREVLEVNKVIDGKEVPDHLEITVEMPNEKSEEILLSLDGTKEVKDPDAAAAEPAGDEDIDVADLPKAVTEAIKKRFPKAEIKSAEKGEEDEKPIFEAGIKSDGHNIDVTLTPDGDILSFEKTVKENELPKAVKESLGEKYPHATIKLVEEVWENDKLTGYEATVVTADKKKIAVTFDPAGKLVEEEKDE